MPSQSVRPVCSPPLVIKPMSFLTIGPLAFVDRISEKAQPPFGALTVHSTLTELVEIRKPGLTPVLGLPVTLNGVGRVSGWASVMSLSTRRAQWRQLGRSRRRPWAWSPGYTSVTLVASVRDGGRATQAFISLICAIGGPIYAVTSLAHGDFGQAGIAVLFTLFGVAALWTAYRKSQVRRGQKEFWLRQRGR